MTAQHTPTPWRLGATKTEVVAESPNSAEWGVVATMGLDFGESRPANAARIVQACNAHEQLMKSLQECVQAIKNVQAEGESRYHPIVAVAEALLVAVEQP